jgi:hypothetical protein
MTPEETKRLFDVAKLLYPDMIKQCRIDYKDREEFEFDELYQDAANDAIQAAKILIDYINIESRRP